MKFHVQLFLERLALSIGATYHDTLKVIRTLNIVFSSNQDRSELPAFITFPYVYSIICSQMCRNFISLVVKSGNPNISRILTLQLVLKCATT